MQAALEKVSSGISNRLIVQLPIRHGKSELTTIRYPVYRLEHQKALRIVVACHTQELASKFGRKSRRLAESRFSLSQDRTAAHDWETPEGGRYRSVGVGGAVIGDGFDLLIVDDPFKSREEAESVTIREKVWEWFSGDLYGRQEPGAAIILIMSRWHEDDLVGRALNGETGDTWDNLRFPALAEEEDPLGRAVGQALCPERYDETWLRNRESAKPYEFLSQYQQRPSAKEGHLFQVAMLQYVDRVPIGLESCRAWDLAATEGDGDWTAGTRMSGPDGDGLWYVEPLRFQHEPNVRNQLILQTSQLDGVQTRIRIPQDPGAAGKESAGSLIRLLAGFTVKASTVSGDKFVRAEPFAAQVNAGNVRVVTGGTPEGRQAARDYVEELRQAPHGAHDDMIDGSSDAFNELAAKRELQVWSF